jgi:26S proteasome regulatory subunit N7
MTDYTFADKLHLLQSEFTSSAEKAEIHSALLIDLKSGFYRMLCSSLSLPIDKAILTPMEEADALTLGAIDAEIAATREAGVEPEISKKVDFFLSIGNFQCAADLLKDVKTIGTGAKIDQALLKARIGNFALSPDLTMLWASGLESAQRLCESGGDWERRNKFLVYAMIDMIGNRNFLGASEHFRKALTTFTCTEVCSFKDFVFRGLVAALAAVDRQSLKKLVESPEVLSVFPELPGLAETLHALHAGRYAEFFRGLPGLAKAVLRDRVLAKHWKFLVRNFRLRAYRQFLTAFKSVKVATMAGEFGLGSEFLENEIADFIFAGKLACKIDQVTGVIEAGGERHDHYGKILMAGDNALNKLQKLAKVIDM